MKHYYIDVGGQKKGPYTLKQLRAMWARGAISARNLYCEEGGDKWRKLEVMQSILQASEIKPDDAAQGMTFGRRDQTFFEKLRDLFKS